MNIYDRVSATEKQIKKLRYYYGVISATPTNLGTVPEYADNAAALAGGLVVGDIYRTGEVVKVVF